MDVERRKELERRRAAAKENAKYEIEGTIITRLRKRGVSVEPRSDGIWTPAYIRVAGNKLWWPDSPLPIEEEWCGTTSHDDPTGSNRQVLRQKTIARMLARAAAPDTVVRFSYDTGFETSAALRADDAIANLDVLLDFNWTIWITARPQNWLIELDRGDVARLAMPPHITPMEEARNAAKLRQWTAPLADELTAHGAPFTIVRDNDPEKPDGLDSFTWSDWGKLGKALKKIVDPGDILGLRQIVMEFLSARVADDQRVAVTLGYSLAEDPEGSPFILLSLDALRTHFDAVVAMGLREIDERPLPYLQISSFQIRDIKGRWMMYIRMDYPYWRVEAEVR